jgi:cyanate permease
VNLDPACAGVAIVLDRPAQQALANAKFAVLLCALPLLKGGHACLERDVDDPPE